MIYWMRWLRINSKSASSSKNSLKLKSWTTHWSKLTLIILKYLAMNFRSPFSMKFRTRYHIYCNLWARTPMNTGNAWIFYFYAWKALAPTRNAFVVLLRFFYSIYIISVNKNNKSIRLAFTEFDSDCWLAYKDLFQGIHSPSPGSSNKELANLWAKGNANPDSLQLLRKGLSKQAWNN